MRAMGSLVGGRVAVVVWLSLWALSSGGEGEEDMAGLLARRAVEG